MKTISLDLTLLAPTCIAQRPTAPGQIVETLPYLSGTALRGAVAERLLAGRRPSDLLTDDAKYFRRAFLAGEVRFANAWPQHDTDDTQIVPRSAGQYKHDKGWRSARKGKGGKGVFDRLADLLRLHQMDDQGTWDALAKQADERVSTLEPLSQSFASVNQDADWQGGDVQRRLISRTAITPMERGLPTAGRAVAADGQLYSFEALEAGQRFRATVHGPADVLDWLKDHGLVASEGYTKSTLTLGQGRSRGLGLVELVNIEDPHEPKVRTAETLVAHARTFSARAGLPATKGYYLPVTLESDVILRDAYLLPCVSGDPAITLARYRPLVTPTGTPIPMTLSEALQSSRWLGGWDVLRQLPRPPQLAVTQGSVWVYQVPDEAQLTAAITWWLAVALTGLGERCAEGFGRVRLVHPFHAEDRPGGW